MEPITTRNPMDALSLTWAHSPASYGVKWSSATADFQIFALEGVGPLRFAMKLRTKKDWSITEVLGNFGPILSQADFRDAVRHFFEHGSVELPLEARSAS